MRIITGSAKGKRLQSPRGTRTRPTLGRARESLFDILTPRLVGARFLDLFAGSGSIGIEALSRSAQLAVFVENDERAARSIRANLETTGVLDRARVLRMSALPALARLAERGEQFDLIFIDPPYGQGWMPRVFDVLAAHQELLAPAGVLIAQQHHKEPVVAPECLVEMRQRRIGDTRFIFYRRAHERAQDPADGRRQSNKEPN